MTFRIPRGKHRARPFRFGLFWKRKAFKWHVLFEGTCRYDLKSDDQADINKLCGVGYLPGHHYDSARFGWRYWVDRGEIELYAYCYVNGRRIFHHIGFCEIGKWYKISLFISQGQNNPKGLYYFTLDDIDGNPIGDTEISHYNNNRLGWRLGVWFGGNNPAPHDIKIQLEKA